MDSLFDLTGQNILITGATGHLGQAFAEELVRRKANLILLSRSEENLKKIKENLENYNNVDIELYHIDLMCENEINRFIRSIGKKKLNGIIHNAYSGGGGSLRMSSPEDFKTSYQMNVVTPFYLNQQLVDNLKVGAKDDLNASIIHISSMYGVVVPDFTMYDDEKGFNPPYYGVSKAGMRHLTKYTAVEFAKYNIRVNTIIPGPFPNQTAQKNEKLMKGIIRNCPMERIGNPLELVGALVYLLSKSSSYTTGSEIVVDGGWTIRT